MEPKRPEVPLRVAAYCRVSTDKEDQRNSLEAQRAFFFSYIGQRPGWALVGVFADEGLSGTSAGGRPRFTELIRRAMAGEIDLILTKEVSRFARNTVDALQITRQLKERGVGVCFLSDNLDTRDSDGEFRLTIMASVAQEESRKISERTRWGQLQAMRRGVVFGNGSIYGYHLRGGVLTVDPEQADTVRLIYHKFLTQGKGAHTIARELTAARVPPPLGLGERWSPGTVLRLLHNEKYCGDLLQKKYRTTDYLTHRKVPNDGAEEQFCLRDHHPAIVSRAQYEAVQAELARRRTSAAEGHRHSARHWYSGKVRCGACGRSFTAKRTRRRNGGEYVRFVCRGRLTGEPRCAMRSVPGEVLTAVARHILHLLLPDASALAFRLLQSEPGLIPSGPAAERDRLARALRRQECRKDRALNAYLDGLLSREDLERLVSRCEEETARLRARLEAEPPAPPDAGYLCARLERELAEGEAVLDELIRRITVCPDCFLVEVAELPVLFRVRAEVCAGKIRRVRILECTLLSAVKAGNPRVI